MLIQKRPLFKQSKENLNETDLISVYWVQCSLLKKYSVIKHTIEQYTVNEVNVNSYDIPVDSRKTWTEMDMQVQF